MKTKKSTEDKTHESTKPLVGSLLQKKWYVVVFVVAALGALIGWLVWFYSDHALPNVMVGGVKVGNATAEPIRQAVRQQASALSVTFDNNGKKTTVLAKDLGVTVDVEATVRQAVGQQDWNTVWQDVQFWQTKEIPLVLKNDPGVLIAYARQHFPTVFVDAKEPQIVYNNAAGHFEIIPGVPGKGLDIKSFERALPDMAKRPSNFTLKLTSSAVDPLLDQDKIDTVKTEANQHILQSLEFKLDDKVIYKALPADIANWAHFIPDTTKGTVQLEFDKAKIQQFLAEKVGPKVAAPPLDRKVIVDQDGSQTVLQPGRVGSQLQNIEDLSNNVLTALTTQKPLSQNVSIATAPFKTVTMKGTGKWIEVDLSRQHTTLYLGDQVVHSFLISSGTARTPTRVGEFAIHSKVTSQTMTGTVAGDYFYIPNVKWVSYFDGDEAFHGTYWHSNFGRPMSHGCINMTEANAKILYDFAPIGTRVVVHQ